MLTECLTKTFSYLSQKLKSHQVKAQSSNSQKFFWLSLFLTLL